ncbi:DUF2851 family protein [Faecalibacter sp. LW9]|uniref:DUF2851 family protein n=1 Tax=Faecalibacter sp. LW9 TaxID=3103144 RepID=UPI002AFFCDA2|nr:DUF2851 family protein [Faecalibacter sp. LW9]
MKEAFLHHIWNHKLLQQHSLRTFHGSSIEIIRFGQLNFHSGPDFLEAEILIGKQLWIGSVEMHVNSSDWELHRHSNDPAYHNVILHVVWNHDCEIDFLRQRNVETLILQEFVAKEIVFNYNLILNNSVHYFPCEKMIKTIDFDKIKIWFDRLIIDRLELKSKGVLKLYEATHHNWEEVTFKLLAYNMGLKINADAFEQWSNSFPFQILQKNQFDPLRIYALFFGQAGFLTESMDDYMHSLKVEYEYIQHKYQLKPLSKSIFRFSSLRPPNFPSIRLAQLVSIYSQEKNLFSQLVSFDNQKDIELYFENFEPHIYWNTHFVFGKQSKSIVKRLSKSKIHQLIINWIIPLRLTYDLISDHLDMEWYLQLLESLKSEENRVIENYQNAGVLIQSAKDSQTILHLKKYYCDEKKCLNCAIGNEILKS